MTCLRVHGETNWIKSWFNWLKCIPSACHLAPDHSSSEGSDETAVVCHVATSVSPTSVGGSYIWTRKGELFVVVSGDGRGQHTGRDGGPTS